MSMSSRSWTAKYGVTSQRRVQQLREIAGILCPVVKEKGSG